MLCGHSVVVWSHCSYKCGLQCCVVTLWLCGLTVVTSVVSPMLCGHSVVVWSHCSYKCGLSNVVWSLCGCVVSL